MRELKFRYAFAKNCLCFGEDGIEIFFDDYGKLCAMITTNNWSTGFFLFDIGLFQGCVLSTILFDCVFQLLLDFLSPKKTLGYVFKATPSVSTFNKAYADDLTLITRNSQDMQISVDQTNTRLHWTQNNESKTQQMCGSWV